MIITVQDLRQRAMLYAEILLWAHVPLVLVLGLVLGSGGMVEAALLAVIAAIVSIERRRAGPVLATQMAAVAGLAIAVSTIVYLLRGHPWQADSHMIFFAAFALTAVFCDWRPIVTYAAVIAVHHLVLNFTLTAAVFPDEASLGRVVLHAAVLIVQAVPLIWLSTVLARMFAGSDALVQTAQAARATAQAVNLEKQREREDLDQVVSALQSGLRDLAAGTLTRPIAHSFADPYDTLRQDFNTALARLAETISQVVEVSHNVWSRSAEISAASENLSQRTENQAAALEQTAAALDELTASVKQAADGAREVESIVQKARNEAEQSSAVVERAVTSMSEIQQSSQQISQIIGAIDDIAFQTNLLALNAGVEAARAGDAGRGFAVVASEVRALAQRSSTAAKEIKILISASAGHVERGVDQVGQAGQALHSIFASVAGISNLVSRIAEGASEQSTGLAEINSGVNQLDQVTQQNAAMVEESTAASNALQQDATGLSALVGRFDTGIKTASPKAVPVAQAKPRPQRVASPPLPVPRAATGTGVWQDF